MITLDDTKKRRVAVALFLSVLSLLGLLLHRDYGIGWDEPTDRQAGYISLRYVAQQLYPAALTADYFQDLPELRTYREAAHGVAFQMPLAVVESVLFPHDLQRAYWLRHLLCFGTFVLGTWATYRIGRELFNSWRWGLLGAGLLVLSPRIFAEAFYNHKDLVFMNLFALGVLTLLQLLRRPTLGRAVLHALVTALAVDVRIMGLLLPVLTAVFAAFEMWARPVRRPALLRAVAGYAIATGPLLILFWPYLWEDPVRRLWECFGSFRRFRQTMDVFYLGQLVSCQRLPWHYLPVWLVITTPVAYTLLFGIGVGHMVRAFIQEGWTVLRRTTHRRDLLLVAWCLGPLVLIVLIHSVVYDGWRHVYFIYPAFLLLAVRGLRAGWLAWRVAAPASTRWRMLLTAAFLLGLNLAHTAWRQVRDHPYQFAYFSLLSGSVAGQLFERDYWGVSGRDGLAWVLAHDTNATVTISDTLTQVDAFHNNALLLTAAERARLKFVPHSQAQYFLGLHRWHPAPYEALYGTAVHEIQVDGLPILTILKRQSYLQQRSTVCSANQLFTL